MNAWNGHRADSRWSKRASGGVIGGLIRTVEARYLLV